ncbi:antitoxin VapB1 [Variibacter gotjawalensis]|uniref:Antitoxin VapB1 n=1 Tax=Variibacter gotjawalensis TaxID=1333996 RepID=A0A0S3PS95_9BRAD|nr:type II toxin-antitoxin system VapB family antitoxin [Variibacter gotjawalensis]NIK49075.1 antitoxin VapB [Variibacter gotjawalensis]RZS50931.1 antitoxin VapB [Variibacter gotjawalensis]BAT58765.1 antitoxin VapB1 [Variibacter gotjawalensis]
MPRTAKIFQSGNSQAVRLPKDFRFDVSEVEISRDGDAVILRPVQTREPWAGLKAAQALGFDETFSPNGREQPEEQHRPELDDLFE